VPNLWHWSKTEIWLFRIESLIHLKITHKYEMPFTFQQSFMTMSAISQTRLAIDFIFLTRLTSRKLSPNSDLINSNAVLRNSTKLNNLLSKSISILLFSYLFIRHLTQVLLLMLLRIIIIALYLKCFLNLEKLKTWMSIIIKLLFDSFFKKGVKYISFKVILSKIRFGASYHG
jgi:hypothetical protein